MLTRDLLPSRSAELRGTVQIQGATAIVTGGANGIGAAIARRLASAGAAGILVADLEEAAATAVADELVALGVTAVGRRVDVAVQAEIEAMVLAAEAAFGPVDLMVSNAGIGTNAGIEADPSVWQRSWEVNVLAHVHAARAVLPSMLERGGGAFVHTCSAAGLLTMLGDAPYAVTKHAAVAFAEWLSITYGSRGIQVGALCPQGVETDLLRAAGGSVAEQVVRLAGKVLQPDEVAEEVVTAIGDGRFLILPHPEVADHLRHKASDPERWLSAMRGIDDQLAPQR
jgi:NAD(P)-dependent dehydrogenase (short-subunit alcohol dehydrogenase family)